MRKTTLAVDRMRTEELWRRLRSEFYQLERMYPPTYAGSPLKGYYDRISLIARELERRGIQGRLDL